MSKNYNEGHRERLRQRFLREGMENMPPHNLLELLLHYGVPRIDTNRIAHMLIEHAGGLQNVKKAPAKDLQAVPGVGANMALMLNFVGDVGELYETQWFTQNLPKRNNPSITQWFYRYFQQNTHSDLVILYVNQGHEPLKGVVISKAALAAQSRFAGSAYREAASMFTDDIVLAQWREEDILLPSREDFQLAQRLMESLTASGLHVVDYYIFGKRGYHSLKYRKVYHYPKTSKETSKA